ncbi:protein-glutamate O-methyltransferase CheR [Uliginosibacterium sp. sgz301328]|uniref:CheR family methyltransferase n=1 Tax=Uliginosibacterium sp. sgz301328 TaxID=3243764 RepID=UPI00359ECBE7
MTSALSERAFLQLQRFFADASGIQLASGKQTLVASRLRKRVELLGLASFDAYCDHLSMPGNEDERQRAIDLLTTNETYFFREPAHFEMLSRLLRGPLSTGAIRIWSAACSTGEEPYSIAMSLADHRPDGNWEVVASDLSSRALEAARSGMFRMQRLELMPPGYLQRFCLRGTGKYAGSLLVQRALRQKVRVIAHNLLDSAAPLGRFDVIFLRNALIYFDAAKKQAILGRVIDQLLPGGLLFVGHSESLHGHRLPLQRVDKAVYRRI